MRRLLLLVAAVSVAACGADIQDRRLSRAEADAIRDRAHEATDGDPEMGGRARRRRAPKREAAPPAQAEVERPPEATTLPEPEPGNLVGDGFGPTQREAVLDARRTISEQIVSRMTSDVSTRVSEHNGAVDKGSRLKVRTQSAFDHVELIETLGIVRRGPHDFAARVVLNKRRAARVYADEIHASYQVLERLGPIVDRAIRDHDASVLLRADRAPAHLLAEQRRRAAIIKQLGQSPPALAPKGTLALSKRAAKARAHAVIRLRTDHGKRNAGVARGVLAQVERLMAARGCRMVSGPAVTEGPVADATIKIHTRPHRESGLEWTYVGLELGIVDARNGKPIFDWAGMPHVAHGGGPDRARADAAAVRRVGELLPVKAGPAFAALYCR